MHKPRATCRLTDLGVDVIGSIVQYLHHCNDLCNLHVVLAADRRFPNCSVRLPRHLSIRPVPFGKVATLLLSYSGASVYSIDTVGDGPCHVVPEDAGLDKTCEWPYSAFVYALYAICKQASQMNTLRICDSVIDNFAEFKLPRSDLDYRLIRFDTITSLQVTSFPLHTLATSFPNLTTLRLAIVHRSRSPLLPLPPQLHTLDVLRWEEGPRTDNNRLWLVGVATMLCTALRLSVCRIRSSTSMVDTAEDLVAFHNVLAPLWSVLKVFQFDGALYELFPSSVWPPLRSDASLILLYARFDKSRMFSPMLHHPVTYRVHFSYPASPSQVSARVLDEALPLGMTRGPITPSGSPYKPVIVPYFDNDKFTDAQCMQTHCRFAWLNACEGLEWPNEEARTFVNTTVDTFIDAFADFAFEFRCRSSRWYFQVEHENVGHYQRQQSLYNRVQHASEALRSAAPMLRYLLQDIKPPRISNDRMADVKVLVERLPFPASTISSLMGPYGLCSSDDESEYEPAHEPHVVGDCGRGMDLDSSRFNLRRVGRRDSTERGIVPPSFDRPLSLLGVVAAASLVSGPSNEFDDVVPSCSNDKQSSDQLRDNTGGSHLSLRSLEIRNSSGECAASNAAFVDESMIFFTWLMFTHAQINLLDSPLGAYRIWMNESDGCSSRLPTIPNIPGWSRFDRRDVDNAVLQRNMPLFLQSAGSVVRHTITPALLLLAEMMHIVRCVVANGEHGMFTNSTLEELRCKASSYVRDAESQVHIAFAEHARFDDLK